MTVLQHQLGHAKITTSMTYLHLLDDDVEHAVRVAHGHAPRTLPLAQPVPERRCMLLPQPRAPAYRRRRFSRGFGRGFGRDLDAWDRRRSGRGWAVQPGDEPGA